MLRFVQEMVCRVQVRVRRGHSSRKKKCGVPPDKKLRYIYGKRRVTQTTEFRVDEVFLARPDKRDGHGANV